MAETVVGHTTDDILNILSADDSSDDEKIDIPVEDEPVEDETKEEDESDSEGEEEVELKEEDEEKEPEEELELVTHVGQKEILKKYPELFKEFPSLKRAYFKEQQYAELLPTIEDAREAVESATQFKQFEEKLLSGSTTDVLKSVKDADQEAFNRIVDNYLPDLQKVDPNAWHHIMGNIFKQASVAMATTAQSSNDEELLAAAQRLYDYMFHGQPFTPATNLARAKQPEEDKLKSEREAFLQEQFDNALNDVESRVSNVLKSSIASAIDPKDTMPPYVKKTAIKDTMDRLDDLLDSDPRFKSTIARLWENAKTSKFSRESKEKIKTAILSKAKTTLPSLISQTRKEALKGISRGSGTKSVVKNKVENTGRSTPSNGKGSERNKMPAGMDIREFLDQD